MNLSASRFLQHLNPQQREAVLTVEGPALVVAGPGTGKTRTLTLRLAYVMTERRIPAENLLAVTFTTRAAREMGKRLQDLVGKPALGLFLGTFHGFCLSLLRDEAHRLGLPSDFGVCDRRDQTAILLESMKHLGLKGNSAEAHRTLQDISRARNQGLDPQGTLATQGLSDLFTAYQKTLRKQRLVDFDDLLSLTVQLLESLPETRQRYQVRYPYISVDEYQDVNPLQYRLLRLLAGETPNLWAVGDADQAIYAFRGAQVDNFLRFERDFPGSRVIRLEQGYRSTPQIVAAANQVIVQNQNRMPLSPKTCNPAGKPIRVISLPEEEAEAAWVVREIEERVGGTSHYQHHKGQVRDSASQRQGSFRDFAVLFRLNALARPLEEALARSGIPYRVVGGTRLFDRKAVKDLLAYLRVLRHPEDGISLRRILNAPPRGIGSQTQAALESEAEHKELPLHQVLEQARDLPASQARAVKDFVRLLKELRDNMAGQPLSQFLSRVLKATDLGPWRAKQGPRHENDLLLLQSLAAQHDDRPSPEALDRFLAEAALAVESDDYDAGADAVSLMTLHAAKGLEFSEVFLCGMEEEILPYTDADIEEERRLFYVGLTRAQEQVNLLTCRSRFLFGERMGRRPSRFLSEFEEALQEKTTVAERARRPKGSEETQQLSLL